MKKNFLALGLAAMMLTLPGCVKDTTTELTEGTGELVKRTFTVKMELPANEDGSRLTLNGDNAFVWEAEDQITIMGSDGVQYTATFEDPGIEVRLDEGATFYSTMPSTVTPKYAWRNIAASSATVTLPSEATVEAPVRFSSNPTATNATIRVATMAYALSSTTLDGLVSQLPMVGTFSGDNVIMRNTFAIAEIKVKAKDVPLSIWSAHMFSSDLSFRGLYGHINVTSNEPVYMTYNGVQHTHGLSPLGLVTIGTKNSAEMNGGIKVATDAYSSIFIAVPTAATSHTGGTSGAGSNGFSTSWTHDAGEVGVVLRMSYKDYSVENFAITKLSSKAHTFTRNMITPMTMTVGLPENVNTAIDLSADGDSNCYMVKPGTGDYKFKAFNWKYTLTNGIATNVEAVNRPVYDIVLPFWKTPNTPIKDIWYYGGKGETDPYIYFSVNGNANGSMIIGNSGAALEANGQTYTTSLFHLWVTDAADQTYNDMTALDRNVGATYAPKSEADVAAMDGVKAAETCGFYYQWGSMKPLPGPKSLDDTYKQKYGWEILVSNYGLSNVTGNSNYVTYRSSNWSASGFTVYPNNSSRAKSLGNYRDYNMQMFAYISGSSETLAYIWAHDLRNPLLNGACHWAHGAKGAQDPCPQGYRVATHDELIKIFRSNGTTTVYPRKYDYANKRWSYNKKYIDDNTASAGTTYYGGYVYSNNLSYTGGNFVWFPHSGLRNGNAANPTSQTTSGQPTGSLRYNGPYLNTDGSADTRTYIWGVPDTDDYNSKTKYRTNASNTADTTKYPISDSFKPFVPYIYSITTDNIYPDASSLLAITNACPIRCVKMDTADAALSVNPISGSSSDSNTWK